MNCTVEPVAVAVHDHAGEVVRLAEGDAVPRVGRVQLQDVVPKVNRPARGVRGRSRGRAICLLPTNKAARGSCDWLLNRPASDEVAAVETRSTSSPSAGLPSTRSMAPGEHPRVPPKERLGALGLQDDFERHAASWKTASEGFSKQFRQDNRMKQDQDKRLESVIVFILLSCRNSSS